MLECYYMNVNRDCSKEQSLALYESLQRDRKEKVDRLKKKNLADKQILISAFLQQCLAKYVDIPPSELEFKYNEQGKPYIEDGIYFNMSHSGEYVVLAVSDYPVGIDIERIRANRLSVAKRCFCVEEYEDIINAETEEEQNNRFAGYWTMKEAYIKYVGKGLLIPLNSFRIVRSMNENTPGNIIIEKGDSDAIDPNDQMMENKEIYVISNKFDSNYYISICCERKAVFNGEDLYDVIGNASNIYLS